jgi:hypothetical protein
MISTRQRLAAAVAVVGLLAGGAPLAGAGAAAGAPLTAAVAGVAPLPVVPFTPGVGPCGTLTADGQGGTAGVENRICVGSGLVFVGPSVGQVASVMGPTIIGPAVIGTSVVSAGNVAVVP